MKSTKVSSLYRVSLYPLTRILYIFRHLILAKETESLRNQLFPESDADIVQCGPYHNKWCTHFILT